MKNKISLKDWDTSFFECKVGTVDIDHISKEEMDLILMEIKLYKYDLVYFFASHEDEVSKEMLNSSGAYLVDQKVVFEKGLDKNPYKLEDDKLVILTETTGINLSDFSTLVLQAAEYSRFKNDPNLDESIYKKMYLEWMRKSLTKELADFIIVYMDNNRVEGFMTAYIKDNIGFGGIMAVETESRGKSIGTKLIQSCLNYFIEMNCDEINFITQLNNVNACSLYKKIGFTQKSVTDIYHFHSEFV
jgi:ribosomal protein S18 acetylase RimI-like enzyme